MPEMMVESFARGLLDRIMLEAFDYLETNTGNGKLRAVNFQEDAIDGQTESAHARLQMQHQAYVGCNGLETLELIEKAVRGLRDVQIGDSSSVLPAPLSKLEKQVKRAACNIGSALMVDSNEAAEIRITQGQGDVHQIIHDAVIEDPSDSPEQTVPRKEAENCMVNDATKVSINLLHRMIEELETENEDSPVKTVNHAVSKEEIAAWEENEEKFIRTIEVAENTSPKNFDSHNEEESKEYACCLDYQGVKSSSSLNSQSFSKDVKLQEVTIEEIVSLPLSSTKDPSSPRRNQPINNPEEFSITSKPQRKKKRGVINRMQNLLRSVFGRRRN